MVPPPRRRRSAWQDFVRALHERIAEIEGPARGPEDRRRQLRAYHAVGMLLLQQFREGLDDAVRERLKSELGRGPNWWFKTRKFAETYHGRELDALLDAADTVKWTHVVVLLGIPDRRRRARLLRRAVEERLSAEQLRVLATPIDSGQSRSGRRIEKPVSTEAALAQVTKEARRLRRRCAMLRDRLSRAAAKRRPLEASLRATDQALAQLISECETAVSSD